MPPEEMRALIGDTDQGHFDNPSGGIVLPEAGSRSYGEVLDFGCGCGRLARQFLQQHPQPTRYVGVDLHAGMVRWCQENLAPVAHQFSFVHHDVFTAGFNPEASANVLELPVDSHSFDLVVAYSVFTHLVEDAAVWYLRECSRVLKPDGILLATWFLFDKRLFPMMQVFQNALYINLTDPTNAVIFDREWLRTAVEEAGLAITAAIPPTVRGYQWVLSLEPARSGRPSISLPEDTSQLGSVPPPLANVPPHLIGSEERITPAT